MLGEAISAVREAIRDSDTGSAHPASSSRFRTCTASARTNKYRPRRDRADNSGQRSQRLPFGCYRPISRARWLTKGREGLGIASGVGPDLALSEHGPCLVEGTVTLDDVSFTMKIAYISRATLDSERRWAPLDLGTSSFAWAPKRLRG